jgi:hypothetical protein
MTEDAIRQQITLAIAQGQVLLITYQHKKTHKVSTCSVRPYSLEPGARSKTGKNMLWGFCLDHQRIEQRIPELVISITSTAGNYGDAPPPPFSGGLAGIPG